MQPDAPYDQPATEADRRRDLERLDEALAVDVERLLHGSVEEVEQVLDGLFEETAAAATVASVPGPVERALDAPPSPTGDPGLTETVIEPASGAVEDNGRSAGQARRRLERGVRLVGAPLHLLGPTGRRAVDWLAITLLLWVPVIWYLVLAMRR